MDHLAAAEFERRVQARARVKDMTDRVDLLDRLALLRLLEEREELALRVGELEAERGEPAGAEWGVRVNGSDHPHVSEESARWWQGRYGGQLVSRAPGPWRAAT